MNERTINDLAVKSGLAEDMGRGYKFPDNYLDFAELIVKECMDVAKYHTPETEECEHTWLIHDKIAKHFGVES